jgi:hypothetical protein
MFTLTVIGTERARESFDKLIGDQRSKIIELRKEYQMWGRDGLLVYVFTNYPEYTHESKMRGIVLRLKKDNPCPREQCHP